MYARTHTKGFSFIEVLIGVLIFGLVSGAMGIFIMSVFKQSDLAECQTIAMNAAQSQFERIRLLMDPTNPGAQISFDDIIKATPNGYNNHPFDIVDANGVRDPRFQGISTIQGAAVLNVTIRVTWQTPLSGNQSYTLTARLTAM